MKEKMPLPAGMDEVLDRKRKLQKAHLTFEDSITRKRTKYKQRHEVTLDGEDFYWGEEI